ncbi:MAG: GPI anchored serine-threonine rich family protein [Proteobacteria bacterium]|nr:GPI anchored serine-threonine rich family protein [Pseudomonadota bacterium]
MKIFRELFFKSVLISFFLIAFPLFAGPQETLEKEHTEFYKAGEVMDIGKVLGFDSLSGRKLIGVRINYNMLRSRLKGEWILNEESSGLVKLKRGLKKEVSFEFNIDLPAELGFRLSGEKGQIQVRSVSAVIEPIKLQMVDPVIQIKKVRKLEKLHRILPMVRSFDVISPFEGNNLTLGSETEILWQMTGMEKKLYCELWRGEERVMTLFEDIPGAKGKYSWKISGEKIMPGGNYRIRLKSMDNQFTAESGRFSISQLLSKFKIMKYIDPAGKNDLKIMKMKEPIALKVIEPGRNTQWEIFNQYPIKWESRGLNRDDKILISLKSKSSVLAKIIAITENTGMYNYIVPYPVSFFGDDIRVIVTPLKERSVEVLSPGFSINKPAVDLICSSPKIEIELKKKKRKTKWWERLGDIFTGGVTYYVRKNIEVRMLKEAVLHVNFSILNNGSDNLRNVESVCTIITHQGYPEYEFPVKLISRMIHGRTYPVEFVVPLKDTPLKEGNYLIEIWLDPFNDQNESDRLRKNNRIAVDFRVGK